MTGFGCGVGVGRDVTESAAVEIIEGVDLDPTGSSAGWRDLDLLWIFDEPDPVDLIDPVSVGFPIPPGVSSVDEEAVVGEAATVGLGASLSELLFFPPVAKVDSRASAIEDLDRLCLKVLYKILAQIRFYSIVPRFQSRVGSRCGGGVSAGLHASV